MLVILDGVRISDPNSAGLTFDLRLLDVSQIERIELLKGASSALYGTHAAVGVLSITTKKRDAGTQWGVWTKQSLRQSDQLLDWATQGAQWGMDLQHQMGKWGVMLQTQSLDNRGISALMDTPEADRFQQQQWKISTDYTPNDRMKYRLGVEYSAHESAYDDAYLMQDRDFMYTTDMWRISLQSELTTRKGSWHRSMAWTQISSEDQSDYPGVYKGFNWNSDTYYKTSLSQNHFLLLGLQAGYDVVPDIEEEISDINKIRDRMYRRLLSTVEFELNQIAQLRNRPVMKDPSVMIKVRKDDLTALRDRSHRGFKALLDIEKKEIKGVIAHLRSLSPQSTMDRGYSVVQSDDGKIVRDATKLKAGAVLRIRAAKGEARASVLELKPE